MTREDIIAKIDSTFKYPEESLKILCKLKTNLMADPEPFQPELIAERYEGMVEDNRLEGYLCYRVPGQFYIEIYEHFLSVHGNNGIRHYGYKFPISENYTREMFESDVYRATYNEDTGTGVVLEERRV